MKIEKIVLFVLFLTVLSPMGAWAGPATSYSAPAIFTRTPGPTESFGLGVSSFGGAGGTSALTAWLSLNDKTGVQLFLGIPTTTGDFNFSAGGAYKVTTHGSAAHGFHVGANALLGSTAGSFTVQTGGLLGIHFTPAPSLLFAFDGGPQLTIVNSNADFSLDTFSAMLGASLMYFF